MQAYEEAWSFELTAETLPWTAQSWFALVVFIATCCHIIYWGVCLHAVGPAPALTIVAGCCAAVALWRRGSHPCDCE
jgi:hypothetical protein